MNKEIVIATRNPGKAKDFAVIFEPKGYQVKTLLDYPEIEEVEESGYTFEENARLKAETIAAVLNIPVLADDSGICVDAIDGQPGVFSARFAGEPKSDARNNAKLLAMLGDLPAAARDAHFHCTLVLAVPGRESLVAEGRMDGSVAMVPSGSNGFGYDPLFYLPEYGKTLAELSAAEKNAISHRARAVKALEEKLGSWLNGDEPDENTSR